MKKGNIYVLDKFASSYNIIVTERGTSEYKGNNIKSEKIKKC